MDARWSVAQVASDSSPIMRRSTTEVRTKTAGLRDQFLSAVGFIQCGVSGTPKICEYYSHCLRESRKSESSESKILGAHTHSNLIGSPEGLRVCAKPTELTLNCLKSDSAEISEFNHGRTWRANLEQSGSALAEERLLFLS